MIRVKIMRHGERIDYTWNWIPYWLICFGQYWKDSPLTTNGHITANKKGQDISNDIFNPKTIYSSPYNRTLATSTEIKTSFPKSEIVIEPLLSEYQSSKHRVSLYPNGIPTTYNGEQTDFSYPENYNMFTKRVHFIINNLLEKNNNDIVIVTHGELLKVYIEHIQSLYPEILLDPGSISYLMTLSFDYDKVNKIIVPSSIKIE